VAQGRKLPNIENPDDLDAVDLKLYEHMRDTEDWTYRSAAKHADVSVETAFRRICRLRKSDFVTAMREDLERLGGKITDAISAGLDENSDSNRASVAIRVATGLGILVDKSKREHSGPGGGPVLGDSIIVLPSNGRGADPAG